jgi:general secretion pathway protein G
MRLTRSRRGFTLIELLVVLAIVSTLLLLVSPRYFHKVDAAKETVLRDNLRAVRETLDKFYGDNGRYPESLEELVEKKYLRSLPVDPITESANTWELVPVPDGYQGSVYDIRSGARESSHDGRKYADW